MQSSANDTELDDAQLLALGRIAFWSSHIESTMRDVVVQLADRSWTSNAGQIVRALSRGASWSELERHAIELIKLTKLPEGETTYLLAQVKAAGRVMERRNAILHGRWLYHGNAAGYVAERRNGSKAYVFDERQARALADEFADAAESFAGVYMVSVMGAGSVARMHLAPFELSDAFAGVKIDD